MPSYTQDNRPLSVTTPLGKDVLLLERLSGEEAVSRPFQFTLEMLSENAAIDASKLLRKPVRVTITLPGGGSRLIHGRVSRFAQLGRRAGLAAYRAEMVPWLWFLSLSNDCRIFQNLSVTDIAEQLFTEAGFTDFKIKVLTPLAKREYCVQYRETTLDFVSRLLEEEGVFYYFEHQAQKHTLVITDHAGQAPDCPGVETLRMATSDSYAMVEDPVVLSLDVEHAAITGSVALNSFDYEHPSRPLFVSVSGEQPNEWYDYFGGYTEIADGDRYARLRLEQRESEHAIVDGESNCAALTTGHKFELIEHPNRKANQAYHLVSVRHAGAISNYVTGGDQFDYSASFRATPTSAPYRPPLRTPRPFVRGTQTAIVTGPAGEEIYVDKLGRVKLHFHWDRRGAFDEKSSCWVRVSSAWAGQGYGNFSAPRIGQEVIVDFLEGDPDQPIIVGRVYNGEQTPPCDPGGKGGVISGLRSKTHKGSGFNEMSMDDTPGSEKLNVHAQYNMDVTVGNDQTNTIGNNRTTSVAVDDTESVGSNQSIKVGASQKTQVSGNRTVSVSGNDSLSVSGNRSAHAGGNMSLTTASNLSAAADAKLSTKSGSETSIHAGADLKMSASGAADLTAGGNVTVNGSTIKLSAGGSGIEIGPGGIKLTTGGPVEITAAVIKDNC